MARFEVTTTIGEKILVDHEATGMSEILSELSSNKFLVYREVRPASSTPVREVIVASGHIAIVRPLDGLSTQSTTFRPKR